MFVVKTNYQLGGGGGGDDLQLLGDLHVTQQRGFCTGSIKVGKGGGGG
jgi:hypothetical protein